MIKRTNGESTEFKELVRLLDEDLNHRYGILQDNYNQYNTLNSIKNVVVAYSSNIAVGCGAFKEFDNNTVEIKRMFLKNENRGGGLAAKILKELESWAVELGYSAGILETGKGQPEAIRFYNKNGYSIIENYGQYIGNTNSLCMKKYFN